MFEIVKDSRAVASALRQWRDTLKAHGKEVARIITYPGGADENGIIWLPKRRFWACIEHEGWCPYGYIKNEKLDNRLNITIEINPASTQRNGRGRILRDKNNKTFLAHRGGKGGGRGGQISIQDFQEKIERVPHVEVERNDGRTERLFLLGETSSPKTITTVADYIEQTFYLSEEARINNRLMNLVSHIEKQDEKPPGWTDTLREILARVGQPGFRRKVLKRWDYACAVSGVRNLSLIRASHIRPWSECSIEDDRVNAMNGLALSPNYDALFDSGLISFKDNGEMLVSSKLSASDRQKLAVPARLRRQLSDEECRYMQFHREEIFSR